MTTVGLSMAFRRQLTHLEKSISLRLDPDSFNRLAGAVKEIPPGGNDPKVVPADVVRKRAILKFKTQRSQMTKRDWRFVAWSLSERIAPDQPSILETANDFSLFNTYVEQLILAQRLARQFWSGMAFSYFSCENPDAEVQQRIEKLGRLLDKGLTSIIGKQRAPRAWSLVADRNRYLFGKDPTAQLADAFLSSDTAGFKELNDYIPIASKSWLWKQLVSSIGNLVQKSTDVEFKQRIDALVALRETLSGFENQLLSMCLSRYSKAKFRDEVHRTLKSVALTQWGSPQVPTKATQWRRHVDEDTFQMVLSWFAREDLEHFFRLLQGNNQVDHDRLKYWLRFVNQMGFTRILLGPDAQYNMAPDFVDFRQRNKGRYGKLAGDAYSTETSHLVQLKPATHSTRNQPPIPWQTSHP